MIIPCKNFAVEIFTCKLWRNALILGQSGGLLKIWFITYTSTIGLIKGIVTYKPDKGTRLATYAIRCIENAMSIQR
ncbi:MAG: hypothetical protein FWE27_07720, partial [Defluviitaleaceae bacterium]|nr:hypothetical protein [Defluviitaleaceae bacterium]